MSDPRATPAMQQYYRFKQKHPDCLLLFRIGDFYETFDDDAVTISKALGLTLTQRTAGVPMAGVPHHQLENYLKRLVAQGFRVAVGEQLIDASQAKGIVPRAVTRVLTPGTLVDESLVDDQAPGALAAIAFTQEGDDSGAAIAIVELSTGDFRVAQCAGSSIVDELARRGVRELLFCDIGIVDGGTGGAHRPARVSRVIDALRLSATPRPAWHFRPEESRQALLEHFGVSTLAGFGLRDDDAMVRPAGAILRYLNETQTLSAADIALIEALAPGATSTRATLRHLRPPRVDRVDAGLILDATTLRALEIERTLRAGAGPGTSADSSDGSLLGLFLGSSFSSGGRAGLLRTAMGKRLLREWLTRPLRDLPAITARQDAVEALVTDRTLADALRDGLSQVQDVPRIAARLAMGRATPRDLVGLARSLASGRALADSIAQSRSLAEQHGALRGVEAALSPLASEILAMCVEAPPPHLREGGLMRDGVDAALDEARLLQRDAGAWLAEYQARLIQTHNLPSLKVGFNRVFGYYIELPAAQARTAPAELLRKQTLRNAERFTTPELREFEGKVTTAEARALDRERELFAEMCQRAGALLEPMATFSGAVATLDALAALAEKAVMRRWVRPEIVEGPAMSIHAGRHPVLDELLSGSFVPNDTELGSEGSHAATHAGAALALITGPNMAGKSTYIRQTALIALLAHTGSFVPADRATIGLVDRIFTRIGADDALHAGQSTFMVEMIETANIVNHATRHSLVILDEIGRGTSTLDGLSLAWAIVEHLAALGPRTLFATHYHELTDLEERLPGKVKNLHVAVREWPGGDEHAEIVFLHRILAGRTDRSYGLHVARLAGIPASVVGRARSVLETLEVSHGKGMDPASAASGEPSTKSGRKVPTTRIPPSSPSQPSAQFSLFTEYMPHPALDQLRELKLDAMSPMEAFDALRRLRAAADGGGSG